MGASIKFLIEITYLFRQKELLLPSTIMKSIFSYYLCYHDRSCFNRR